MIDGDGPDLLVIEQESVWVINGECLNVFRRDLGIQFMFVESALEIGNTDLECSCNSRC